MPGPPAIQAHCHDMQAPANLFGVDLIYTQPPRGPSPPWGGPAATYTCPHACHCVCCAAPQGGRRRLGAALRRLAPGPSVAREVRAFV